MDFAEYRGRLFCKVASPKHDDSVWPHVGTVMASCPKGRLCTLTMHERIRIMGCLTTPPDAPTAQRRNVG
jgi:hypothetical protein